MTADPMASRHRWIYLGSIVLLVAMLVTGLLAAIQDRIDGFDLRDTVRT
ncbi:hypothetical protein PUR71_30410 [Streptomyces sp. SP17BM10]|nr:hypothetical protein [Streptomyces sp. SP17BM10]MEE1787184.1 hypothetical protein [Streptomyces sp. SP17BM10]